MTQPEPHGLSFKASVSETQLPKVRGAGASQSIGDGRGAGHLIRCNARRATIVIGKQQMLLLKVSRPNPDSADDAG